MAGCFGNCSCIGEFLILTLWLAWHGLDDKRGVLSGEGDMVAIMLQVYTDLVGSQWQNGRTDGRTGWCLSHAHSITCLWSVSGVTRPQREKRGGGCLAVSILGAGHVDYRDEAKVRAGCKISSRRWVLVMMAFFPLLGFDTSALKYVFAVTIG